MASSSIVVPGHCTPRLQTLSWWKARRPPAEDLALRAAQYVRMSTDHQQYSTANQKDAIVRYAREHGLDVVRTYADEGKSVLSARNRPGLCALLNDVAETPGPPARAQNDLGENRASRFRGAATF